MSCSPDRVSPRIAHSEVNAIILAIVEDLSRIVDALDAIHDSENIEAVCSPIIQKREETAAMH